MNKWQPDPDPQQARRVGKTLEELGELTSVLARISIQGIDAIDPATGKTNRQRMIEETADVLAQIACNVNFFAISQFAIDQRMWEKIKYMAKWESHFHD